MLKNRDLQVAHAFLGLLLRLVMRPGELHVLNVARDNLLPFLNLLAQRFLSRHRNQGLKLCGAQFQLFRG